MSDECNVCYTSSKKYINCTNCEKAGCSNCQLIHGKPFCMTCGIQFTQYQLYSFLTKKELDNSKIGKFWKEIYLIREKNKLPLTIEYINYEKDLKEYNNQKRFGSFSPIKRFIKRDIREFFIGDSETLYRRCIEINCKGYIINNSCNLCNIFICNECGEKKLYDHKCNPNTILTLKETIKNSKPCPNCNVHIYKSEGCDHMRCTNCGTYFSWTTLRVQRKNTNPIKNEELINNTFNNCNTFNPNSYLSNIKVETGSYLIDRDPYVIQSTFLFKYNNKCNDLYNKTLLKYRISYIENKLSEEKWIENIYKTEYDYQRNISITETLLSYLGMINDIIKDINNTLYISDSEIYDTFDKSEIFDKCIFNDKIEKYNKTIINELINYNKIFEQIKSEFGGKLLVLKCVNNDSIPLRELD